MVNNSIPDDAPPPSTRSVDTVLREIRILAIIGLVGVLMHDRTVSPEMGIPTLMGILAGTYYPLLPKHTLF